ncbi:MAG TPA: M3 family metallopeptidase [Flavobacteriales bacterium]|nr:M3 family metallopeptidase [Flavobacteriales bacterium]HMW95942.1 M3 family metallopeptidase [Flavobacteriales bacterium]HNI04578.1 M3 family metallopeptidase [Flavobacteriales bacterium]
MKHTSFAILPIALAVACGAPEQKAEHTVDTATANPLAAKSTLVFQAPLFNLIKDSDYEPAIEAGMKKQLEEVRVIVENKEAPSFENTIVAMEKSGQDLTRAAKIFFGLTGSATNDTLQAVKARLAPKLTAHGDAITMNDALFQRVKAVHDGLATDSMDPVRTRLVERYFTRFKRAGALLDAKGKEELMKLNEEEANLNTRFQDNILKARSAAAVLVDKKEDLDGLDEEAIAAAAESARSKGHEGKWLIEIVNTTTQPVLSSLKNRALRERIFKASIARNSGGEADNSAIVTRLAQLRARKAQLLGFPNWAAYVMDDQMARTPESALKLLAGLAPAAARNAKAEADKLQALIDKQKGGFQLEPWDWDFYSEQVRKTEHDLDEAAIRPYLEFDSVLVNGVFFAAEKLYGVTFKERHDLPVYHPDVRVFDIIDTGGKAIGLFYGDYYARDNKQGGAWMDSFLDQCGLLVQQPVITQNCNYVKPAEGKPLLLSFDDVTTLFHEFGHALHGMLSRQEYPLFAGTATATDFVEFPSQINEALATDPAVLAHYARHYKTREPMPAVLLEKMKGARKFNQGYLTSEYLAAALLDIEWHSLGADAPLVTDVAAFERAALEKYGLFNAHVPPRYKTNYFSHIWGGGYAANYYAYMWSEVLDADGVAWFHEHGGFNRPNGMHFRSAVLSQGGSKDAGQLYRDFTGRDARLEPLLERRGLN